MRKKYDNILVGLALGIVLPVIMLLLINLIKFKEMNFFSFMAYAWEIQILGTWLKPAILPNLVPFWLFTNNNRLRSARGVLFATIIYGLFIAYLTLAL